MVLEIINTLELVRTSLFRRWVPRPSPRDEETALAGLAEGGGSAEGPQTSTSLISALESYEYGIY